MEYPSKALEKAIASFKSLPGIGNKTAVRLVLHLIKQNDGQLTEFETAIQGLKEDIKYCDTCFNLSDEEKCKICANPSREQQRICVVCDLRDVMAIESTGQYKGTFHVLGGVISPMEGIGPSDLKIKELIQRTETEQIDEIIFALSATIEGDTTIFYISKLLKEKNIKLTTIAKGISIGGELEYVDEITLARSLNSRVPFES